jgi:hypothetical protein
VLVSVAATMLLAADRLTTGDYWEFLKRLAVDLVALLLVAVVLYVRRHERRDRLFVFAIFNVGVFAVLAVITEFKITAAVGFGLFALLSIIRLRSEPFANVDLGYFFVALVLAVVNGISHSDLLFGTIVSGIVVLAVFAFDHPHVQTAVLQRDIVLDAVHNDATALEDELRERFGLAIVDLRIVEVDFVRETTTVVLHYLDRRHPLPFAQPEAGERR